ncbi:MULTISPECIES: sulfite exporter TauE/SafE family protein [unclassified Flavobacterium]|uniref:sulfite exporter TauE/SafE family protein n=1 Tax=unclassified Flavobacterium TaxID=196869 RepID=UPI003608F72E
MEIIGYIAAVAIGITLGLIGGGGSILTVPILVYLFRVNPELATSYSLFIVGVTAAIGSYKHYLFQNLKLKEALYFAIPSLLSLLTVRKFILPAIPHSLFQIGSITVTKDLLIMLVFGVVMLLASKAMISRKTELCKTEINYYKLGAIGLLVGFIIGFLGAGGGFLIIPALIFFGGIPMKKAVGTSLLIIAINSLIGFSADIINGITINLIVLLSITFMAIIGMLIGSMLSKKVEGGKLKSAFGWFVLVMGILIIGKELFIK